MQRVPRMEMQDDRCRWGMGRRGHCSTAAAPRARWSPLTLSRALLLRRSSTEGHFVLKGGGMRHRPPQLVLHAR